MESQRTSTDGEARLLEATRESVILHGVRRTTANDIAERAGISRMTFYRRAGSVENAVLAALTHEFRAATATLRSSSPGGTGRNRLVYFAVASVRVFATSPLLASIAERDPEFLIPYVTDRFGTSQQLVLEEINALLDAGVKDGSISARAGTATLVLLALQGVAISSKVLLKNHTFDDALDELGIMLDSYLGSGTTS